MTETSPLVAGAGLAGAAAAVMLARGGRKPLVIDRQTQVTEKVCGCFLSFETVAMLRRLGVDVDDLGASHIERLRLFHEARVVEAKLPFPARGLSRSTLDGALLAQACERGAVIRFGAHLSSFAAERNGSIGAMLRGKEMISAPAAFLATGKHDVRAPGRTVACEPGNIAFKQMFRLKPGQTRKLQGVVELYLFNGGYAGLQLVEDDIANFCMVVGDAGFQELGGSWDGLLAGLMARLPPLGERLANAEALLARPLAVSRIPYGFVHHPDPADQRWLFRLGDQAAVIPSFSGDGMAIALHSGIAAARCYLAGRPASLYHAELAQQLGRQFWLAALLHRMAEWHWGRAAIVSVAAFSPPMLRWAAKATRLHAPSFDDRASLHAEA